MEQPALAFSRDEFDVPAHVAKGSVASRRAAERLLALGVQGKKVARLMGAYQAAAPGTLTMFDVEARTGLLACSICAMRHSAVHRGWLVAVGMRPGPYGVEQTTHRITPAGLAALAKWHQRQLASPRPRRRRPTATQESA